MTNQFYRRNTKAAKLTWSAVEELRRKYEAGATQGELCREYGLSVGQVGRIVRGESWKDIKGGEYKPLTGPMDFEASAARVLQRVAEENAREEAERALKPQKEELSPELQARMDAYLGRGVEPEPKVSSEPPPSPLDGGDAPDETQGQGLARMGEVKAVSPGSIITELKNLNEGEAK